MVGGLGTAAVVLFAVVAFRSEERARRADEEARIDEMADRAEERVERALEARRAAERARDEANVVNVKVRKYVGGKHLITAFTVNIHNGASKTPIFKVAGDVPGYGQFRSDHEVKSGQSAKQIVFGGMGTAVEGLPLAMPEGEQPTFFADLTASTMITFEMNDRHWRRVASNPAEQRASVA